MAFSALITADFIEILMLSAFVIAPATTGVPVARSFSSVAVPVSGSILTDRFAISNSKLTIATNLTVSFGFNKKRSIFYHNYL